MYGAHLPWGIPLVIMEPSLHTDNGMTGDVAKYKVALGPFTVMLRREERERHT